MSKTVYTNVKKGKNPESGFLIPGFSFFAMAQITTSRRVRKANTRMLGMTCIEYMSKDRRGPTTTTPEQQK
eukprot:3906649-Amphidinium_carterae.1